VTTIELENNDKVHLQHHADCPQQCNSIGIEIEAEDGTKFDTWLSPKEAEQLAWALFDMIVNGNTDTDRSTDGA